MALVRVVAMIAAAPLITAFAAARAQIPRDAPLAPAADLADWIAALADPSGCAEASRRLCAAGARAVPPLLDVVQRHRDDPDQRPYLMAIYTLGKLGAEAAPAAPVLSRHLGSGTLAAEHQVLWALGELAATTLRPGSELAAQLTRRFFADSWSRYEQRLVLARGELGPRPDPTAVARWLESSDHVRITAAAAWLRTHPERLPDLLDTLLPVHRQAVQAWRRGDGFAWRLLQETACIVSRHLPHLEDAADAHVFLLSHHDGDVRLQAVMALRDRCPPALVPRLGDALFDQSPEVVREAVVALGAHGDAAVSELPPLLTLAASADRRLAALAATTIRRIRENASATGQVACDVLQATVPLAAELRARVRAADAQLAVLLGHALSRHGARATHEASLASAMAALRATDFTTPEAWRLLNEVSWNAMRSGATTLHQGLEALLFAEPRVTGVQAGQQEVYVRLPAGMTIAVGDRLEVLRRGASVGFLHVDRVSRGHAECLPVDGAEEFAAGDVCRLVPR